MAITDGPKRKRDTLDYKFKVENNESTEGLDWAGCSEWRSGQAWNRSVVQA